MTDHLLHFLPDMPEREILDAPKRGGQQSP